MDSALRPREIQARIRAGQSLEEVARVAGVPAERIEPFAAPVIAEREHIAGLALAATVRRRGETSAHRNLRPVVAQRLTASGVDPDEVEWDAWREEDRRWSLRARYRVNGQDREGLFRFDQAGRFSIALNDDARWLIADPNRERDDSDELALVRALRSPDEDESAVEDQTASGTAAESADDEAPTGAAAEDEDTAEDEPAEEDEPADPDDYPTSAATPQEIADEVEAEINSYGVVPQGRSELDVLYDMLGGIAEDSINIYAGLSDPVLDEGAPAGPEAQPAKAEIELDAPDTEDVAVPAAKDSEGEDPASPTPGPDVAEADATDTEHAELIAVEVIEVTEVEVTEVEVQADPEPDPATEPDSATEPEAGPGDDPDAEPTNVRLPRPAAAANPDRSPGLPEAAAPPSSEPTPRSSEPTPRSSEPKDTDSQRAREPEQPSLVDLAEDTISVAKGESGSDQEKPAAKRKPRKKRASVPSWDEIMFGGPPPKG
ncbi:hypothetical protein CGZ93_08690 [Enemella dayhoffiae]|uniref:DUF3071 domain-containing protein n=2 Tax=Enemella dayhoffiae TaxID=2016507 RepID=A0A255H4F9_9ACTN|nr:hypothetical protein CGZ93_08690 [Enemella dayhoffiae]